MTSALVPAPAWRASHRCSCRHRSFGFLVGRDGTPVGPYRGGGCKPGAGGRSVPPHGFFPVCGNGVPAGFRAWRTWGCGGAGGSPAVVRACFRFPAIGKPEGAFRVPSGFPSVVWLGFQCRRRIPVVVSIPSLSMSFMAASYPSFQPSMYASSYAFSHSSHVMAAGSRHRVLDTCIGLSSAPSMVWGGVSHSIRPFWSILANFPWVPSVRSACPVYHASIALRLSDAYRPYV